MSQPSSIRIADEKMAIMPTAESRRVVFDCSISSIAINRRGKLLAVGMGSGEMKVCDALTLGNIYEYQGRRSEVTSISFSNDSKTIASGDTSGTLLIHDTLTTSIQKKFQFESSILHLEHSKLDQSKLVILLKDGQKLIVFSILDDTVTEIMDNITTFGLTCQDDIICATKSKTVNVIKLSSPDDVRQIPVKTNKMFRSLAVSPDGEHFLLFDEAVVQTYTKEGTYLVTYKDSDEKYSCGCFWMDSQHIFLGGKNLRASSFRVYILFGPEMVFLDMQSSKVQATQMIANPVKPWLYIRGKKCLQVWSPSKDRLIPSCPVGQQMITNEEYYEREDEWDKTNNFSQENSHKFFRQNIFIEEEDLKEESTDELYELPCTWE